jgi:hypothetical protein
VDGEGAGVHFLKQFSDVGGVGLGHLVYSPFVVWFQFGAISLACLNICSSPA